MNLVGLHELKYRVATQLWRYDQRVAMNDRVDRTVQIQSTQQAAPDISVGKSAAQGVIRRHHEHNLQGRGIKTADRLPQGRIGGKQRLAPIFLCRSGVIGLGSGHSGIRVRIWPYFPEKSGGSLKCRRALRIFSASARSSIVSMSIESLTDMTNGRVFLRYNPRQRRSLDDKNGAVGQIILFQSLPLRILSMNIQAKSDVFALPRFASASRISS